MTFRTALKLVGGLTMLAGLSACVLPPPPGYGYHRPPPPPPYHRPPPPPPGYRPPPPPPGYRPPPPPGY